MQTSRGVSARRCSAAPTYGVQMSMRSTILSLLLAVSALAAAIEQRGSSDWPTRNHMRIEVTVAVRNGSPVLQTEKLPPGFNPDSVRVLAANSRDPIASKVEWRTPQARISWISRGAGAYCIYFDVRNAEKPNGWPLPRWLAQVTRSRTAGQVSRASSRSASGRIRQRSISTATATSTCWFPPSAAYNGIFLFRNLGTNEKPLFDQGEWLGKGVAGLVAADFNGDGAMDLVVTGGYYSDVRKNGLSVFVPIKLPRSYWVGRDDYWYPVDWDGDGKIDVLAGVSDWRDYGWDDGFNAKGEWTRGPLHGYVYFHRNTGTNAEPRYAPPVLVEADGKPIDQYGSPVPIQWPGWHG